MTLYFFMVDLGSIFIGRVKFASPDFLINLLKSLGSCFYSKVSNYPTKLVNNKGARRLPIFTINIIVKRVITVPDRPRCWPLLQTEADPVRLFLQGHSFGKDNLSRPHSGTYGGFPSL